MSGNILKASRPTDAGLMRLGLWGEHAKTHRSRIDFDVSRDVPNYDQAAVPGLFAGFNNVLYEQGSSWWNYQPFAEFEYAAAKDLTITPGVKYMTTTLKINAAVNQSSRITQNVSKDFNATLPFLTANYRLNPAWSAYAQYARGMLVPDISSFQSSNADITSIQPQRSTNYQAGVVHVGEQVSVDFDGYFIDFNNKIATLPGTAGSNPVFYNQGGVTYKGAEGQLTYALAGGFSVYTNGSLNSAKSKTTGKTIAGAPDSTAALGLLYRRGPWSGTLLHKRVGSQYALDDEGYKMNPYSTSDVSLGYTITNPGIGAKTLRINASIFNLLNRQDVITVTPKNTAVGPTYGTVNVGDQFLWQPARSYMVSARAEF